MIGVDTNVLVRFLARDNEAQANRVRDLFERCYDEGTKCVITIITLCELEWVLTEIYNVTREEIANTVYGFLLEELFEVEESSVVKAALNQYRQGRGDLSDYLLGARGRALGVETTYTFDKALRDSESFTLL